jgi:hypothetical protein
MRLVNTCVLAVTLGLVGCTSSDYTQDEPDASTVQLVALVDAGPPPALPLQAYGEFCLDDAQCGSSFCYQQRCTETCDARASNSCRDVEAFCVDTGDGRNGCSGHVETGTDADDDATFAIGQLSYGKLQPAGDADLFTIFLRVGMYEVAAQPWTDADVRVEVYGPDTKQEASFDGGAIGEVDGGRFLVRRTGRYFVVVRDVAGVPTTFSLSLKAIF